MIFINKTYYFDYYTNHVVFFATILNEIFSRFIRLSIFKTNLMHRNIFLLPNEIMANKCYNVRNDIFHNHLCSTPWGNIERPQKVTIVLGVLTRALNFIQCFSTSLTNVHLHVIFGRPTLRDSCGFLFNADRAIFLA